MSEIINAVFDAVETTLDDVPVSWMEYTVGSVIPGVSDDVISFVTISRSEFAVHSFLEKVQVEQCSSDSGELYSDK